jgi:membrane carboxypeptidase/penicillin-binding protein PbpC
MVGAWVGNNDNSAMKTVATGVSGATPIWQRIIKAALEKEEYAAPDWVVPPGVQQIKVDSISGYPEHDGYPSKTEYVIKGTEPTIPDPIHTKLKLCKNENKLANDARVASGDFDEKEFVVAKENDPVSKDGKNRWQDSINAWIAGQADERFKFPTESCGDSNEIFVRVKFPENEKKYDGEDIEVQIESDSGEGIEKVELWVDGGLRETINNKNYKGTIKLTAGQHELYAKARTKSGKEKESDRVRIGTGGQDWKAPDPTPTPEPTPSPTATPDVPLP